MTDRRINILFNNAKKDEDGMRPVVSTNLEEFGIDREEALRVIEQLDKIDGITVWLSETGDARHLDREVK